MKAKYSGTCSYCRLAINIGDEIEKTKLARVYKPIGKMVGFQYAHSLCIQAWQYRPEPDEIIQCPLCGDEFPYRDLLDHLLDWKDNGGHMQTETVARITIKTFMMERMERERVQP